MKFKGTKNYVATDELQMAVNAAVTLEKPLLIKGEPGTGKTLLAEEVAKSLKKRLISWHIKLYFPPTSTKNRVPHRLKKYSTLRLLNHIKSGIRNRWDSRKVWLLPSPSQPEDAPRLFLIVGLLLEVQKHLDLPIKNYSNNEILKKCGPKL